MFHPIWNIHEVLESLSISQACLTHPSELGLWDKEKRPWNDCEIRGKADTVGAKKPGKRETKMSTWTAWELGTPTFWRVRQTDKRGEKQKRARNTVISSALQSRGPEMSLAENYFPLSLHSILFIYIICSPPFSQGFKHITQGINANNKMGHLFILIFSLLFLHQYHIEILVIIFTLVSYCYIY